MFARGIARRVASLVGLLLVVPAAALAGCSFFDSTCTRTPVEVRELADAFSANGFSPVGVYYTCTKSEAGSADEGGVWLTAAPPAPGVTRRSDLVRLVTDRVLTAGWKVAPRSDPNLVDHGPSASPRVPDAAFVRRGYRLTVAAVTLHPATLRLYLITDSQHRFGDAEGAGLPARDLTRAELARISSTPLYSPLVPDGYQGWSGPTSRADGSTEGSGLDELTWELTSEGTTGRRWLTLAARAAPPGYDPATSCETPQPYSPEIRHECRRLGTTAAGVTVWVPVTTTGVPVHGSPCAIIGKTLVELRYVSLARELGVPWVGDPQGEPSTRAEVLAIFASLDPTLAGGADVPFSGD